MSTYNYNYNDFPNFYYPDPNFAMNNPPLGRPPPYEDPSSIFVLPRELHYTLMEHCTPFTLLQLSHTGRYFNQLINSLAGIAIWRNHDGVHPYIWKTPPHPPPTSLKPHIPPPLVAIKRKRPTDGEPPKQTYISARLSLRWITRLEPTRVVFAGPQALQGFYYYHFDRAFIHIGHGVSTKCRHDRRRKYCEIHTKRGRLSATYPCVPVYENFPPYAAKIRYRMLFRSEGYEDWKLYRYVIAGGADIDAREGGEEELWFRLYGGHPKYRLGHGAWAVDKDLELRGWCASKRFIRSFVVPRG